MAGREAGDLGERAELERLVEMGADVACHPLDAAAVVEDRRGLVHGRSNAGTLARSRLTALAKLGREPIDDNAAIAYVGGMATLNIRRLPEDVHAKLRVRAAKAGRSMEAEARMILADAVRQPELKTVDLAALRAFMMRLCGGELPTGVADDLIEERRREARRELAE
jgi:plasmid stability protein